MLESILQKFRGIILGLMVFSLSAVFVLQFGGPQAQGCSQNGAQPYAAEVYGSKITLGQFRAAYSLVGGDNYPPDFAQQHRFQQHVLQGLVERELLVREARKLGLDADEDEVMQRVAEDGLVHASMSVEAGPYLPPAGPRRYDFTDTNGKFSKDNLRKFIQFRIHRSVEEFAREQTEETIAQAMREAVVTQVVVSPSEVWDAFVREKESVTIEYARFSPSFYKQRLEPSDAELAAFTAEHQKDVDDAYARDKQRYTGLEKQVRARHILIKVDESASDEEKAAAKARAEALRERAKKGEDFATLARRASEDTGSAKKGGDLGYNPKGRMVSSFDDAQFALAPGQLSELVESQFGFHIIKVEGIREGDVPEDEVKRELAHKLYLERKSAERSKDAAHRAFAELASGKSPEALAPELGGKASEDAELDPSAPQFRDTAPFGRTDTPIAGAFDGTPLVRAAFELSPEKALPEGPIRLGDEWVVYRLKERVNADAQDLDESERERIRGGLLVRKQRETLIEYVRGLLRKAEADEAVFVDSSIFDGQPIDNS